MMENARPNLWQNQTHSLTSKHNAEPQRQENESGPFISISNNHIFRKGDNLYGLIFTVTMILYLSTFSCEK